MKTTILLKNSQGPEVEALRTALAWELGTDAKDFPALQSTDGPIDDSFDAAIRR